MRIMHEAKLHKQNTFLTLTYNDENIPKDSSVDPKVIQNYMKRLRNRIEPKKIRFFGCGEYGDISGRPHYHIIIFGMGHSLQEQDIYESAWANYDENGNFISLKGFVYYGDVEIDSARYTAKYVTKRLTGSFADLYDEAGIQREFALMSRRPGIGASFADKYIDRWLDNGYIILNGVKVQVPEYYYTRIPDKAVVEKMKRRLSDRKDEDELTPHERRLKNERESSQRETNLRAKMDLKKSKL